jgi:gliding motility-associated-like protein
LAASGGITYTWSPAGPDINTIYGPSVTVNPLVTMHYIVTGEDINTCTSQAVTIVTVVPTPTLSFLTLPATICEGDSKEIDVVGATEYTWSPGSSMSHTYGDSVTVFPKVTTTYSVLGSNGTDPTLCYDSKTITITVTPKVYPVIQPVTGVCFGRSINLAVSESSNSTYSWSPSYGLENTDAPSTIANPTVNMVYTVTVLKGGSCPEKASVSVPVFPVPIVNAGKDSTIDVEDGITLFGKGNVDVGFISTDGTPLSCNYCSSVTVYPQVNTCYTLRGENKYNCASYDEVCVNVIRTWDIFIPNSFTPNNDGVNDIFYAQGHGISKITMTIYNRWGNVLFKSDENHPGWDGRYKDRVSEPGVYVYSLEIKTTAGKTVKRTGHVTIMTSNINSNR